VDAHVVAHLGPNREQGALPFVVAGFPDVGLAEVPYHDRPVDGGHDLAQRELVWDRANT